MLSFFFACVCVCFHTSTKASKLFIFMLPWLSCSQTWSHGNTSTNQPLKLCPQPLTDACRVSRSDLIPVGSEKNQTTIRSVLCSLTRAAKACVTVLRRKLAEDLVPSSVVEAGDADSKKLGEVGG